MGQNHSVPPKPPEVQRKTLSAYFDYTYRTKLCFKRDKDEVHDITTAVIKMVRKLMDEVGRLDERFKIGKLLFVGSMMEGTKNGEPNEFDFLVVVTNLSFSDKLMLTRQCHDKKGYVHVEFKEDGNGNLKDVWRKHTDNGKLKSTKSGVLSKSGFRDLFLDRLQTAVKNMKKLKEHKIVQSSGSLVIHSSDVEKHGPACLAVFAWTPAAANKRTLIIEVDITPAIQFEDVGSIIESTEVGNVDMYQYLQNTGVFMCISCGKTSCDDGLCFKLTFTNTEMNIVLDLSPHHRKCYRILKYLFNGLDAKYVATIIFHSYALKTFVLKHHNKRTCDGNSIAQCILDILEEIQQCLDSRTTVWYRREVDMQLPSLLLPTHNIFDRPYSKKFWNANKTGMAQMKKSLDTVANLDIAEDENVDERFRHYEIARVNMYVQRPGPPPFDFHQPYHSLHSSKNMMMMNSFNRMHTMNTHMHMHSFRH